MSFICTMNRGKRLERPLAGSLLQLGKIDERTLSSPTRRLRTLRYVLLTGLFYLPATFCTPASAQSPAVNEEATRAARDKRLALNQEFSELAKRYATADPEIRSQVLLAWRRSHQWQMNELNRQLAQGQPKKNTQAQTSAITPRPAPKALSPQDKQLWDLRESLRVSKSQTLARVSNSSPKAREAAMQAWQAHAREVEPSGRGLD